MAFEMCWLIWTPDSYPMWKIYSMSYSRGSVIFKGIQFNSVQFNSIQFNSIQFNSIQFNSIQFNSIQFNSILSVFISHIIQKVIYNDKNDFTR